MEDHTTEEAGKARRLLQEGDRVILGDWMEWDEGPCFGDSCGEEEVRSMILSARLVHSSTFTVRLARTNNTFVALLALRPNSNATSPTRTRWTPPRWTLWPF